ncbi:MAG: hypothetical protein ACRDNE_17825 [Gaiellaceae bacterium]
MVQGDQDLPRPDLFPLRAGEVFPLYHVLADLARWKDAQLVTATSADPLTVEAIALERDGRFHAVVASFSATPVRVALGGFGEGAAEVRFLDEESAPAAVSDPASLAASTVERPVEGGAVRLELRPYAIAFVTGPAA